MLDSAADAAGDVDFRADGDAGLANLQVVLAEAGIHSGTAGTYLAMQFLGKLAEQVEALLAAHAIATGHDDGRALQVVLGFLHMALDNFYDVVRLGDEFGHVFVDNLATIIFGHLFGLHHTAAHGGHLRPVVGIDDGSHDVAAESGTDLVEQALVVLAGLLVVVVTDFQRRTVGRQAACKRRADARTEVAADDGGAHQADLRLLLLEEVDQDAGMGLRGVGIEALGIKDVEFVHAVGQDILLHLSGNAVSGGNSLELDAQLVG